MSKYKAVIGLEMHCEMKSNTKVFSSAKNSYSDIANINVNPVDMAFPGILPVLNKECVRKAIMAALILNCKVPEYMYFDRKNYYYPDLPKGYQITQLHDPVGVNGSIKIDCNGVTKEIKIHDIHLEEDAASMEHFSDVSLINYNRAGVPLLELVTEPCIESPEEAVAFLEEMRRIYQYADISEADTKKGQIRCDVNVSIMDKDSNELGTKVEVKNVNSFGNVYETIKYEIERQSKLKDEGRYDEVVQETRRFDEETGTTIRMRTKADAIDYKYFVEPNIPKFKLSKEWLDEIRESIPMLAYDRKKKYMNEYGLSEYDSNILVKERPISDYFEKAVEIGCDVKQAANWINGMILSYLNTNEISIKDFSMTEEDLKELIDLIESKTISSKQGKDVFYKCLEDKKSPKQVVKDEGMMQITDSSEIESVIDEVIEENLTQAKTYDPTNPRILDFFVGQVMKKTRGKANPAMSREMLAKKLEELVK